MAIEKLSGFAAPIVTGATTGNAEPAAGGFDATLNRLVSAVETSSADANVAVSGMVEGTTDVHDAMIALQRADLTFQLSMQVRNKLLTAYQEIMRMPV
jgi:flagellar hook-basal body complex protein FliE